MCDERKGVDWLTIDQHVEFDEVRWAHVFENVVERRIALRAALELVVEIDDELGERHLESHLDAVRVNVDQLSVVSPPTGDQLHDSADVACRRDDRDIEPWLSNFLDISRRRQI